MELYLYAPPHVNCQFRHRGTITSNGWTNDRPVLGEYIDTIIRSRSIQIIITEGPENLFWRRRQQVPPKRHYLSTKVHGVTIVTLYVIQYIVIQSEYGSADGLRAFSGQIRYAGRVFIILSLEPFVRLPVNSSSCHWTRHAIQLTPSRLPMKLSCEIPISRDVILCQWANSCRRFERTQCIPLKGQTTA